MITAEIILFVLLAYLTGAFPSAVWMGKTFYNTDVREYGSGNAGATNTFRVLGKGAGIPVLFMDVFKGWLSVNYVNFISNADTLSPELFFENQEHLMESWPPCSSALQHNSKPSAQINEGKGMFLLVVESSIFFSS